MHEHIEELKNLGDAPPYAIPALYWISPDRLTHGSEIQVVGGQTSPEVEFFLAADRDGGLFVTIASDHTDRELETVSVSKSKQVCDKVLGDTFWSVDEIADHWDRIEISSKVCDQGAWVDYQAGTLGQILHYSDLMRRVGEEAIGRTRPGILSGTLPIIGGEACYASACEIRLHDPVLNRLITKTYDIFAVPDRS